MYQGIIKPKLTEYHTEFRTNYQMLSNEQVAKNGVITQEIAIKTKDFTTDRTISYRDFDILNLQAIGALSDLKPTQLSPSQTMVERAAHQANESFEVMDLIKEFEDGQQNQTSA